MPTATIKAKAKVQGKSKVKLFDCPNNPESEFTKIKKLAVAAMFLGLSQFSILRTGERKMPPPIPTIPDKNPILPPKTALNHTFSFKFEEKSNLD